MNADSRKRFGLSVRSRLTLAVTALAAVAFALIATLAPGAIRDALQQDLIESEAETASIFAQLLTGTFDDSEFLRDEEGNIVDFDNSTVVIVDESGSTGEPTEADVAGDFTTDPTLAGFDTLTPDDVIAPRIELLQAVDEFDPVASAAGGPFAVDVTGGVSVLVATNGTYEVVQQNVDELGVPVFTQTELDEYLFEELGLFESDDGGLVQTATAGRVTFGVVDIDGVDYLVAADASSIDRSVASIRGALWLALPLLVAMVAGIAWLLASRALRPVRSITEQAATISGGSLDARVPVPASNDEVATLADTVNEMLDRLETDDRTRRRFISDASHELRSPVAVMRNEAEVALHHPGATDVSELATAVADESKRMASIIDDLLALARHDEGMPAPTTDVDLDDIVLTEARRARRVRIDVAGVSAGRVNGRSDEMARLVGHLLDNAARHASEQVAVSLTTSADAVTLIVDDDGPGVPAEQRDDVFERFTRLDEARTRDSGGAGLGLAVVRGIAERSNGAVAVDDAPLGGARFTVTFPN